MLEDPISIWSGPYVHPSHSVTQEDICRKKPFLFAFAPPSFDSSIPNRLLKTCTPCVLCATFGKLYMSSVADSVIKHERMKEGALRVLELCKKKKEESFFYE